VLPAGKGFEVELKTRGANQKKGIATRLSMDKDDHAIDRQLQEAAVATLTAGTFVDSKFEIIECIGKGGMSAVYKARHLQMDKVVALKILHSHLLLHADSIQRFKNEAQAASRLEHEHIVKVHAFGISEQGPYISMDLIEGKPLAAILEAEAPLSELRARSIILQVISGLKHAHNKGILHRDLKPANILVGQDGTVKLADFGIAKFLPGSDAKDQHLTKTGQLIGSPYYMSPEQCRGEQLGIESDVYSLGCIMYEMLTGVPPFRGETSYAVLMQHIKETPLPFSQLERAIPSNTDIEKVIFKSLSKNPSERYPTLNRLRDALENADSGPKLNLKGRRLSIKPRRRAILLVSASAALLSLVLVSIFAIHMESQKPAAEENTEGLTALGEYGRAQKLWNSEHAWKAESVMLSALRKAQAEKNLVTEFAIRKSLLSIYHESHIFDKAEEQGRIALKLLAEMPNQARELRSIYSRLAGSLIQQGKLTEAEAVLNEQERRMTRDEVKREVEIRRAIILSLQGKTKEAEARWNALYDESVAHGDGSNRKGVLAARMAHYVRLENWKKAQESAMQLAEVGAGSHWEFASAFADGALCLYKLGENEQALAYCRQALAELSKPGMGHGVAVSRVIILQARIYEQQGQHQQAIDTARKAVQTAEVELGETNPVTIEAVALFKQLSSR
jgi:serine/threonine protein kinase